MNASATSISTRLFGLLAGLMIAHTALAWGPEGHALVADIAAAQLDQSARATVSRLLAIEDDQHLDAIASWPDAIRSDRWRTGRWHYVDIPLDAAGYRAARDCPHDACVVAKIVYFAKILGNAKASPSQRLTALKFVVHFVGDVQQPLHAENHADHGGNDIKLTYFGHATNLHALWDSGILDRALELHVGRNFSIDTARTRQAARQLNTQIDARQRRTWSRDIDAGHLKNAAIRWANQSHRLARCVAYADRRLLQQSHGSRRYQRRAWPVVRRQIQRGGVRLAAVLNAVLSY